MLAKRCWLTLASLCLNALIVVGCGGKSVTTPVSPSPTAQSPAPRELQGSWGTILRGSGEQVTLTLSEGGYQITRGSNQASGAISVPAADRIEFSRSTVCSGTGTYRWSLNGNALLFTLIGEPCPGRSEVLDAYTYTKLP